MIVVRCGRVLNYARMNLASRGTRQLRQSCKIAYPSVSLKFTKIKKNISSKFHQKSKFINFLENLKIENKNWNLSTILENFEISKFVIILLKISMFLNILAYPGYAIFTTLNYAAFVRNNRVKLRSSNGIRAATKSVRRMVV
mgnify:CR=1 FL=1